ncbi:MAG: UbiA prenyltransferase family protein [Kiritimatiellae bacterium]|nr:UbiA prenyltransferase family protein [Kiritimatiellia bacterium]
MTERLRVWLRALRVNQWTKNAVVFLAWFFAVADSSQAALARGWRPFVLVAGMAGAFCLVSSAFYLLNDVSDFEADRRHPVKRLRPVASGLVSRIDAVRAALTLYSLALVYPCLFVFRHPDRTLGFAVLLVYSVVQCAYSGFLKRIPYVDVAVLAAGFVLRAVAGAAVMAVRISPWLLACAFALSLFLALAKRRHELSVAAASRAALARYHPLALDCLMLASAAATLGVYCWYTLSPDTVARFGTRALAATVPFVALGLARYVALVFSRADVGRPERILLTDWKMWLVLAGYALAALAAVSCRGAGVA